MPRSIAPPWTRVVDGERMPAQWGGHPALDFCNTLAGWGGPVQHEYLDDYHQLLVFAGAVNLLDGTTLTAAGSLESRDLTTDLTAELTAELARARTLRAAAYSVLTDAGSAAGSRIGSGTGSGKQAGNAGNHDPDPWQTVSGAVEEATRAARFTPTAHGGLWVLPAELGVKLPVLVVARSLGELLESGDAAYVSACPGNGCGWLFLDRKGRRRWCSMAVCGNRAKARRHAGRPAS